MKLNYTFSQWALIQENISDHPCFHDIQFLTDSIGYVVSFNLIGKTIDAGDSWTFDTTINGAFNKLDFINADTGIICCFPDDGEEIILTMDGGESWTFPDLGFAIYPNDAELVQSGDIYILDCFSGQVYVHKFSNFYTGYAGASLVSNFGGCFHLEFPENDTGYVTGDFDFDTLYSYVCRTFDGSSGWIPNSSGNEAPHFLTSFPTSEIGYGVGEQAKVWKTTDYADTWIQLPWDFGYGEGTAGFSIEGIYFYSIDVGFVITNNNIYPFDNHYEILRTIDAGTTWDTTYFESGEDTYVTQIFCTSADTCYMISCNGGIYKTTNGAGFPVYPVLINDYSQISFSLSPVPASSILTLNYKSMHEIKSITTTNYLGEKINLDFIDESVSSRTSLHADISALAAGIYFIQIITEQGKGVQKWIKM